MATPFIKWVGGKTQILPHLLDLLPRKARTYYEPFVGGGAVFFALAAEQRFERAVLSDLNRELMDAYRVVRSFPDDLARLLRGIESEYALKPEETYAKWKKPSKELAASLLTQPSSRAARFIFLNKAGYNGQYRVNRRGGFNVPWGKRTTVTTFDDDNLADCSTTLDRWASLRHGDFATVLAEAQPDDLIYLDPPYYQDTATSFGYDEQLRLARVFRELVARGCYVVASNTDLPPVRILYQGFEIHPVEVRRFGRNAYRQGNGAGVINDVIIVGRRA